MKQKCDICGKSFEGYGNNPAPLEGKVCCDNCNKTYVIPARLKQLKVTGKMNDDINEVNKKVEELNSIANADEEPETNVDTPSDFNLREHIGFLIKDEVEAIEGYDKALIKADLTPEDTSVLEEIRNDELDHVSKLNSIYEKSAKGAIEEDNSLADDAFGEIKKNIQSRREGGIPAQTPKVDEDSTDKINPDEISFNDAGEHQEQMAQRQYEQLKRELDEIDKEIDRNDNNPRYNIESAHKRIDEIENKIMQLKKVFGYALKDESNLEESFEGGYDPATVNEPISDKCVKDDLLSGIVGAIGNVANGIGKLSTAATDADNLKESSEEVPTFVEGEETMDDSNSEIINKVKELGGKRKQNGASGYLGFFFASPQSAEAFEKYLNSKGIHYNTNGSQYYVRVDDSGIKDSIQKGRVYRETVNSQQGYEDWEFTGNTKKGPDGKTLYAMKSERGVQWFDEDEVKNMKIQDANPIVVDSVVYKKGSRVVLEFTYDGRKRWIVVDNSQYHGEKVYKGGGIVEYSKNAAIKTANDFDTMDRLEKQSGGKSWYKEWMSGNHDEETCMTDSIMSEYEDIKKRLGQEKFNALQKYLKLTNKDISDIYYKKEEFDRFMDWYNKDMKDCDTIKDASPEVTKVASIVKNIPSIFDMPAALKKAGLKAESYNGVVFVKINGKEVMIVSKNRVDAGPNDIIQGNYAIGLNDDYQNVQNSLKENEISNSISDESTKTIDLGRYNRYDTLIMKKANDYGIKLEGNGNIVKASGDIERINDFVDFINEYHKANAKITDSDTVNDIGRTTVGSKYRWEERYGNQLLTVIEAGESVRLSLDNSNTYVRIPKEKFEQLVKDGKLNSVDTELIEGYGRIKTNKDKKFSIKVGDRTFVVKAKDKKSAVSKLKKSLKKNGGK